MTTTLRSTGQAFYQQSDNGISVESNPPKWQSLRAVFFIYHAVFLPKVPELEYWTSVGKSACLSTCFVRQNLIFLVNLVRNAEKIAF